MTKDFKFIGQDVVDNISSDESTLEVDGVPTDLIKEKGAGWYVKAPGCDWERTVEPVLSYDDRRELRELVYEAVVDKVWTGKNTCTLSLHELKLIGYVFDKYIL